MELTPAMKEKMLVDLKQQRTEIDELIAALEGPHGVALVPNGATVPTKPERKPRTKRNQQEPKATTRKRKSGGGESSRPSKYFVGKGELAKVMTGQKPMTTDEVHNRLAGAFKGTQFTRRAIEVALDKYAEKSGDGWSLAE